MIITNKTLPRRTFLRGVGATMALPVLDSMFSPLTAVAQTMKKAPVRLGYVYTPNGIIGCNDKSPRKFLWTPTTADADAPPVAPIELGVAGQEGSRERVVSRARACGSDQVPKRARGSARQPPRCTGRRGATRRAKFANPSKAAGGADHRSCRCRPRACRCVPPASGRPKYLPRR